MAEIKDYSVTADDNNSASPNGMPENMAPSGVNNSWRESFARVKRWYEDINATKSTTGSSNAYVLAAARTVAAYAQGDAYMFRANHANTGAATLNIDSVGAVAIVNNTQSALAAGQIQAGGIYLVAYDATNTKFQLVGASATSASGDNIFVFNASPSVTLENSTAEDSDGGRESSFLFKGLQSGSEESTLVKIIGSHDGSSDDQKGKLQIYTNDGSDGDSPTLQVTIDSAGLCTLVGAASVGGALTVAGATQLNSTVTVGADDQGYDVILYGDTASANVTWDTSVDDLILNGAAGLIVPDGQLTLGSTAITSTGAELNYNDTGAAVGTVVASKTVTVDANKDVSSFRNITLTGELDAGSLDVSGNADIDGTLEADAITLNGTALGSLYSPIAGSSSIVTTGALDAGSITSGFGAIDNGTSNIRSATITAETAFVPDASGGADLGSTSLEFNDLFLNDAGSIQLGDDQDVTITHVADTGIVLNDKDIDGVSSMNSGPLGGRRNVVFNPNGAVNQRAGTAATTAINTYGPDRWRSYGGALGFSWYTKSDAGEGDGYYMRFHRTASDSQTNTTGIAQGLETIDSKHLAGQEITFSFRARAGANWSPSSGRLSAVVVGGEGTDQNPVGMTSSDTIIGINADMSTGSDWATFSGSGTVPSDKTQIAIWFSFTPTGTAGANDYFDVRNIQLEIGGTATTFEQKTYGEELALCQRYCTVYTATGESTAIPHGTAQVDTANRPEVTLHYPQKRVAPSITVTGPTNFKVLTGANTAVACAGFSGALVGTGVNGSVLFFTTSSGVATNTLSGIIVQLFVFQNTGVITVDSEL